jgi:hypothetical protein
VQTSNELRLIGRDEQWSSDRPGNRRLICHIDGGGKLAIMGTEADRGNIEAVNAVGFPCTVVALTSEPKEWQQRRRGYTHVVHANDLLRVIAPES